MVSHDLLKRGVLDKPKNGMDRLTLTEVGEYVVTAYKEIGLSMKLRKTSPPFPWEMAFYENGLEISQLTGHFIGPSTFRSIFRLRYLKGTSGMKLAEYIIDHLDRDLLVSDYWKDDTWNRFTNKTGLSRKEVIGSNDDSMEFS